MTAAEREDLEREVIRLRIRRVPWSEVTRRTGVPERTGRLWLQEHSERQRADGARVDIEQIAEEALAFTEAIVGDLCVLAIDARQEHVRLGALKGAFDAFERHLDLAARLGRLPRSQSVWIAERELPALLRLWAEILQDHRVDDAVLADLAEAMEARRPRGPSLVAA